MATGHMSTLFNSSEPQPTHSPTSSVSNLVKSNLGTSLIALAVIPVLAMGAYLVRRYRRRFKRRTKQGVDAMFEDCTPYNYSKSPISSKLLEEKDIQALALPEVAYRSPRPPVVKEVERYKTPQCTATPATSSPSTHIRPNSVKNPSSSLHGAPQGQYLYSYRVPHFVPGVSSHKSEFNNARSPCPPGSLSPSPLPPVGAPLRTYPMNTSGQLLYNIPWIHERITAPGVNSPPIQAPLPHASPPRRPRILLEESVPRSPSSTHSNLTTAELRIKSCSSRHFDGNVEDRYPVALSSSFLSLYTKNSRHDLASIRDDLSVQESEDGNGYDFPTASSVGTSEPDLDPALIVNEYYAFSSDEVVTSRAVQEIMDDDRKNYMGLSRKILQTKTNQASTKTNDPTSPTPAPHVPKTETERKHEHVSTMKILDEFPKCPPPTDPLPQPPRSRKITPIYNKTPTPYAFNHGQNSMVGMGRGSGVVTRPRRGRASWDMSIKENVPF